MYDIYCKLGLEIMSLEAGGVRIIDSLNFLPMPLAAMPKTFGEKELAKGYFPHFFNKAKNADYVGPIPDPEMYGASAMKEGVFMFIIVVYLVKRKFLSIEARKVFLEWHTSETSAGTQLDMQRDLVRYCQSDVDILAKCCMKFRDLFIQVYFNYFIDI